MVNGLSLTALRPGDHKRRGEASVGGCPAAQRNKVCYLYNIEVSADAKQPYSPTCVLFDAERPCNNLSPLLRWSCSDAVYGLVSYGKHESELGECGIVTCDEYSVLVSLGGLGMQAHIWKENVQSCEVGASRANDPQQQHFRAVSRAPVVCVSPSWPRMAASASRSSSLSRINASVSAAAAFAAASTAASCVWASAALHCMPNATGAGHVKPQVGC